jgi:hypothetical protein
VTFVDVDGFAVVVERSHYSPGMVSVRDSKTWVPFALFDANTAERVGEHLISLARSLRIAMATSGAENVDADGREVLPCS